MPKLVVQGAMIQCTMGMAPATLTVIPRGGPVQSSNMMAGTIMDHLPMVNVAPFGMCQSPSNPTVAAATAAAAGVLTPMPCIPVIPAPWTPGAAQTTIGGSPALTDTSRCMCTWGGSISVAMPGQMTVDVS